MPGFFLKVHSWEQREEGLGKEEQKEEMEEEGEGEEKQNKSQA